MKIVCPQHQQLKRQQRSGPARTQSKANPTKHTITQSRRNARKTTRCTAPEAAVLLPNKKLGRRVKFIEKELSPREAVIRLERLTANWTVHQNRQPGSQVGRQEASRSVLAKSHISENQMNIFQRISSIQDFQYKHWKDGVGSLAIE